MGGKLKDSSPPDEEAGLNKTPLSYKKIFEKYFPYYLSIGMTYEQYWRQNSGLTVFYRRAQELKNKRRNEELWLQGAYVYEAILRVSPILHAFVKNGTEPKPYTPEPYPITADDIRLKKKREEEEKYHALMGRLNALVALGEEKGEQTNG